jgi:hypothetical protein
MEMKVLGAVSMMARGANDRVEVGKVVTQECGVVTKGYTNGMRPWATVVGLVADMFAPLLAML